MGLSRLGRKGRDIVTKLSGFKGEILLQSCQTLNVHYSVADDVPFVAGLPKKERHKSFIVKHRKKLKYLKSVSCVDQLSPVQNVTNVHTVAQNLPVLARLNQFWKTFESCKVIRILPFRNQPILT